MLVDFAFRNKLLIVVLTSMLMVTGVAAFKSLKIEAYPDISDPSVVVITTFPGQAAEEMEQQVTIPIERALNSVPRVISRRSRTIFGLSVVELTFQDGTDDYFARQLALEKLRDAELPEGVTPSLGPLSSGISEFYRYTLRGGGLDTMQLRELQDWLVAPRLLQEPGMAEVTTFGGLVKQFQVEIDPLALEGRNLTVAEVGEAIASNNRNAGGAMLSNGQQSLAVRGMGLIQSTKDIENIVLSETDGVPVFVHDVAKVRIGAAPPTGIFSYSDKDGDHPDQVEGICLMRRWENPSEVLAHVSTAMDELNHSRLPKGVKLEPVYDRSSLVTNTLETVSHTLLEGFVVVTAVLLVMLGDLRAAILTAITIPLSLLFAFSCMKVLGVPANLLSLGAFDFGIIVDGTVVMIERIVYRVDLARRENEEGGAPAAVLRAAREVAHPIFVSLLIITAAYLPLFTLERVERRIFTPMASTICLALIGSMLLTLTLIPILSAFLFRSNHKHWENPVIGWLCSAYGWVVGVTVRRSLLTVSLISLLVLGIFGLGTTLGTEFLPQLDEGVIWVRANLPPGVALEKSSQTAAKIRKLLIDFPEVQAVMSQSGRNDSGTDPFGPNRNEFLLDLHPYKSWASGWSKGQLVAAMSKKLNDSVPGVSFNFTQPIIDTSTEIATGSSADLAVIISGSDLKELRRLAEEVLAIVKTVPGAADTSIEQESDQPQLRLSVKRSEVARYGINVSNVQDVIEMAIGGRGVTTVFEGEKRFDVTVRYSPEARVDAAAIGNILVATKDGGRVPLNQLASIQVADGSSIIARRENKRQISVRTNIRARDQGGFVKEAQGKLEGVVKLPQGYTIGWGGQFENLERASKRLGFILPLTILLIFGLLWSSLGNPRDAGLVLVTVPFSLVGGILALLLRGIPLSVSAAVGFISVFGVAVMCGLLYIEEIGRRRTLEGTPMEEAVIAGAKVQMRPQLVLITVATLGMMPAAMATGVGSDVQRPLATVVVGGLISTLFLTLLALPALYSLLGRKDAPAASPVAVPPPESAESPELERVERPLFPPPSEGEDAPP
ncbi:efflux RND transporter permease subunit [bacterium]|nr:efflux RND transporter permease subunit [bacterium]